MSSFSFGNEPELIFFHIPKAAGSSFRYLIWDNYDKKSVFWFGIDLPFNQQVNPKQLNGYKVIGGHFEIPLFRNVFPHSIRAAIVRNPVERAISLFHYYTVVAREAHPSGWLFWREQGINPSSMYLSLTECIPFRNKVSDDQCKQLGGNTFAAVQTELQKGNKVLGVHDYLNEFIQTISSILEWPHRELQRLNTGESGYYDEVIEDGRLYDEIMKINKEDLRLYEWLRSHRVFTHFEND